MQGRAFEPTASSSPAALSTDTPMIAGFSRGECPEMG